MSDQTNAPPTAAPTNGAAAAAAAPPPVRNTAEVVPNTIDLDANGKLTAPAPTTAGDALEMAQQMRSMLESQALEIKAYREEKAQNELKRKAQETQENERQAQELIDKKKKSIASLEANLEASKLTPNDARQFALESKAAIEAASSLAALDDVLKQRNMQVQMVHAACALAEEQANKRARFHVEQQTNDLKTFLTGYNATMSAPSSFGAQFSGSANTPASASTTTAITPGSTANLFDTGAVHASRHNIFADPPQRQVAEVVPDRVAPAAQLNMSEAGAYGKAAQEFTERYTNLERQEAVFPSRDVFAHGGFQTITRHAANADGRMHVQTTLVPRHAPKQIGMQHTDPVGFQQIVAGIQAAKKPGAVKNTKAIIEAHRLGVMDSKERNAKPRYFEQFTGALPSDNLQTFRAY